MERKTEAIGIIGDRLGYILGAVLYGILEKKLEWVVGIRFRVSGLGCGT